MWNRQTNPGSPNCAAFDAVLQSVFDGDRPASALDDLHAATCEPCRELASAAKELLAGFPILAAPIDSPVDFASRIVPNVLAERNRSRAVRRTIVAVAASLAASVLIAVAASRPWYSQVREVVKIESVNQNSDLKPPPVESSFRQAGAAFASLTKRAAEESIAPARNLLAGIELTPPAPTVVPMPPTRASSTVEPITNTAKRAINLFIRDVGGLAPSSNMKS